MAYLPPLESLLLRLSSLSYPLHNEKMKSRHRSCHHLQECSQKRQHRHFLRQLQQRPRLA